jgi:hypothetical protein
MILGFTGTRRGLTTAQRAALPSVLAVLPDDIEHGGAEGADEEFHSFLLPEIVRSNCHPLQQGCRVVIRTATTERFWHWRRWEADAGDPRWLVLVQPVAPLRRNHQIASRCDHLLACPAESSEILRSGTWATIRYARTAGKLVTIIKPDGTVQEERR